MISNNELTLSSNNRYFLHTPVQCNDENGKRQSQSILIDNITDNSLWNMNTEKLKCSLLSSSSQQYATQKGSSSLSSMNTEKCRNVSVYADANKQNIISGYISFDDYTNINPAAILNAPGAAPLTPGSTPLTPGSTPLTPGPSPSPAPMSPGATPAPTQNLGVALNNYLNPKPSPGGSPGGIPTEGFSVMQMDPFSIFRFYFISLFVIFIYILHRMSKKLLR